MMCLCCKVCLGCPLSESAEAVQVEGVDELLIFISTSPRYEKVKTPISLVVPVCRTCNRFLAEGIEAFLPLQCALPFKFKS